MNKAFDDGMRYGVVYRMWVRETVYPVSCGGVFFLLVFFRISLHRLRTFTFGLALVVGNWHRHRCLFRDLGGIYRFHST